MSSRPVPNHGRPVAKRRSAARQNPRDRSVNRYEDTPPIRSSFGSRAAVRLPVPAPNSRIEPRPPPGTAAATASAARSLKASTMGLPVYIGATRSRLPPGNSTSVAGRSSRSTAP